MLVQLRRGHHHRDQTTTMATQANGSAGYRQPLYLRCEMKKAEHRSALTPTTAKQLIDAGFDITVERDPQRIFEDEEFERCVEMNRQVDKYTCTHTTFLSY